MLAGATTFHKCVNYLTVMVSLIINYPVIAKISIITDCNVPDEWNVGWLACLYPLDSALKMELAWFNPAHIIHTAS